MKIACPNCDTKYALNADALGTHGRKMKCAKCAHVWIAQPVDTSEVAFEIPLNEANQVVEDTSDQGAGSRIGGDQVSGFPEHSQTASVDIAAETVADSETNAAKTNDEDRWHEDLKEERAAEEARAPRQPASGETLQTLSKKSSSQRYGRLRGIVSGLQSAAISGWQHVIHFFKWALGLSLGHQIAVLIAFLMPAILTFGLVAGRQVMVRQFPDLASFYAAFGVEVNLYGLEFENVRTVRRPEDGMAVLIVEGSVRNISNSAKTIPRLHFILSGRNREVYTWQDDASYHPLPAGESVQFRTVLASPPDVADELHVRFLSNEPRLNRL